MEAEQTTQKTEKKKFSFKRLFFAIFGKARWFVLGLIVVYGLIALLFALNPSMNHMTIITDYPGEEYKLWDINSYSVSDDGMASVLHYSDRTLVLTMFDMHTGEQLMSGIPAAKIDDVGYITPYDFVAGNDGKFYGIGILYSGDKEQTVTDEYIIEYAGDSFESSNVICHVQYDMSDRIRTAQASRLNFHNDELTFAIIGNDETYLYSIDTTTGNVRVSEPYRPDSNGNYTTLVVPMDDSFLFIQSDGGVYVTAFDEPLTNKVYQIEASVSDTDPDYFIDEAEMCNGKLYVCKSFYEGKVYCIENGERHEVFDVNNVGLEIPEDYDLEEYFYMDGFNNYLESVNYVIDLDTIHRGDKDELSIATELGIIAYDGENVREDELYVTLHNGIWLILDSILEFFALILIGCLFINLIIRKKTLLYKHLAITLPVLLIPTILLSANLYYEIQDDNIKQTREEVEAVCRIASSAFEGFDFEGLNELNEGTGAAAKEVERKFKDFDTDYGEYVFSIVCRTKEGEGTALVESASVYQPLSESSDFLSLSEMETAETEDNLYIFNDVIGIMGEDAKDSIIYAYGLIDDAHHSGKYYIKVQTEPWSFWTVRRNLFIEITRFVAVIVLALTLVTILTSWYITRTIKKATNTVVKIADGDFSARIKYKSKDELGEICSQVNTMANSLENMFDEKDKTEKFYYKFVPEKFRELLGKEHFTDLNLGDAKSRDLTVLFFDIRSFSINSEIMTAKENFEFVNIIYGKAGPIVRRHNGFVDKYIGDAVMALFENADDAVACGIELYKEIVLDPKTAEAIGIGDINIGIGIHSGMARIGIVGEDERLSGTVISDTVNISSRLESLTKQFKTAMLISKDTVDRMSNPEALKMRYLGEIQVAGVNEVKALYEVLDCLDDEECKRRFESIPEFREAVRLFHLGRRAEAAAKLKELADSGKGDYVTEKYYTYISEMSEEEKGNVFRFVRK